MDYKNRDLVKFQLGDGEWRYGRVIAFENSSRTDNPKYFIYAVKLERKIKGHPWDAIMLPGAMFQKVDTLEEMAYMASKKRR